MTGSNRSGTRKLLIIPIIVSVIMTTVITFTIYLYELENRKTLRRTSLSQTAVTLAKKLDQSFTDVNFALIDSAQLPIICNKALRNFSQSLLLKLPQISELRYSNDNKRTPCNNWRAFNPPVESHAPLDHKGLHFLGPLFLEGRSNPSFQLYRAHSSGGTVQAIIHRVWLMNQVKLFRSPLGFMAIIDSDSGVPLVVNGKYSLPINANATYFPINQPEEHEGLLDNRREHYTYIQPLVTQPSLSIIISQDLDSLYADIYGFNPSWIGSAAAGLFLLLILSYQLQRKLSDPIRQIRTAIRRREFLNLYQPLVSSYDHKIIGCQVLMRWKHPFKGILPPMTFIPLAEQSGLIKQMTLRQLDEAIQDLALVLRSDPNFKVSVNICAAHIKDSDVVDAIIARAPQIKGLVLEITEHQVVEHSSKRVQQTLQRLRDAGIKISMDDFGTGYCSLSYLASLPIDVLKADRSFVAALGTDSINADVLQTILQLAQKLGMEAIAEGVEKSEQAEMLRRMGFDTQQGWLHGYPTTAFEFSHTYFNQKSQQRETFVTVEPLQQPI